MQSDFSMLFTGKIYVYMYNTHQLLIDRRVACFALMSILLPSSYTVSVCMGGPDKLVNARLVWILCNVLIVATGGPM